MNLLHFYYSKEHRQNNIFEKKTGEIYNIMYVMY